ncbi:hypothetical protein A2335_04665 [Candidatus Peregrinibacteria bacterium RIFOXYB2_FULL_32_7]|nr:MAG: hypothetical protein A2335_04665 [Candidatus Peregrinibacteria bacterium RIFOXYB2_FULL_32_7]
MQTTIKRTFTLPLKTVEILIQEIPSSQRSKIVAEAIEEYLLRKQREEALKMLDQFAMTVKPKTKLSAVEWLRKDRRSH